jgi:hypothetical protein
VQEYRTPGSPSVSRVEEIFRHSFGPQPNHPIDLIRLAMTAASKPTSVHTEEVGPNVPMPEQQLSEISAASSGQPADAKRVLDWLRTLDKEIVE